jgi:demethylmenaquinone methyltransferase/2-methoxy-6-polyprenyl-1,4-benzoquinol methylase
MLEIAGAKAGDMVGKGKITFTRGEAASLPFPNDYFDTVGISFAFRNLTYRNPLAEFHLAEVLRVLTPGGRFVIVESSQPDSRLIRFFYHLYLRTYVYGIGSWLSGNKGAYKYLSESAARFFTPEEVKTLLKSAGFREVHYRPLLWGAAGVHVAVK